MDEGTVISIPFALAWKHIGFLLLVYITLALVEIDRKRSR